jgi:hypothetical protein
MASVLGNMSCGLVDFQRFNKRYSRDLQDYWLGLPDVYRKVVKSSILMRLQGVVLN